MLVEGKMCKGEAQDEKARMEEVKRAWGPSPALTAPSYAPEYSMRVRNPLVRISPHVLFPPAQSSP